MQQEEPDWGAYANQRNLSRNHLLYAHHQELVEDFLLEFGWSPSDKRVLDVGSANGFFMVLLRELGFLDIDGLEVSPVFLDLLRAKGLNAYLGNIMTTEGFEQLSPPYDIILMMEVLEHLSSPEAALRNTSGLLREGGMLYLTVPVRNCIVSRLLRLRRRISREEHVREMDPTHIHAFSRAALVQLLTEAGFEVDRVRRVSFFFPFYLRSRRARRLFAALRVVLPNFLRGLCLAVVARKPLKVEE